MDIDLQRNDVERVGRKLEQWMRRVDASPRFQLDQEVFTDPSLFELEMKHIFERNWVFLGHESQVPEANDYLTSYVGRQPVVLTRTKSGELKCFINACTHRGARLCRQKTGKGRTFTCGFHGWTFENTGALIGVSFEAEGGYPESFDKKRLGLHEVLIDEYKGFVFASLSRDVPPLEAYLGDTRAFIDLIVDQSPEGRVEVLRGTTRYVYHGNWKMQAENGVDGYHPPVVHANYIMTTIRRMTGESGNKVPTVTGDGRRGLSASMGGGVGSGGWFSFEHGHQLVWLAAAAREARANHAIMDWFKRTHGEVRAEWVNGRIRNLLLFPNVFLMDQAGMQMRIVRPLAVDKTEIISYAIAPVGEPAEVRTLRIRQFEDFFNAAGMATPDDLSEFNNCQIGYGAGSGRFNDMSRGAIRWAEGSGRYGAELGIESLMSGEAGADEGLYLGLHEAWAKRIRDAVAAELGSASAASTPATAGAVV